MTAPTPEDITLAQYERDAAADLVLAELGTFLVLDKLGTPGTSMYLDNLRQSYTLYCRASNHLSKLRGEATHEWRRAL